MIKQCRGGQWEEIDVPETIEKVDYEVAKEGRYHTNSKGII